MGRQFWGHGLRGQGSLAVEKVTYSPLCMVMDVVRLSLQVGEDLDCSNWHAIESMGLGHDGRLDKQLRIVPAWDLSRVKVSPYMSFYSYSYLICNHFRSGGARMFKT